MIKLCKPGVVWAVAACMMAASLPHAAVAATIGTAEVAAAEGIVLRDAADARALLAEALARDDVVAALQERGVDPAAALSRVDALTDAQVQALAQRIDSAPAGADSVLGTIVFIFVLLLVTDILGLTKVFPFTRAVR